MLIYGNTMLYKYSETIDGKEVAKEIKLVFSPMTLIFYHKFVGRDFFVDFLSLGASAKKDLEASSLRQELKDKISKGEELTLNDLSEKDVIMFSAKTMSENMAFYFNLIAAMIATAQYPNPLDFAETINSLPLQMYTDEELFSQLNELIAFAVKKNEKGLAKEMAKYR